MASQSTLMNVTVQLFITCITTCYNFFNTRLLKFWNRKYISFTLSKQRGKLFLLDLPQGHERRRLLGHSPHFPFKLKWFLCIDYEKTIFVNLKKYHFHGKQFRTCDKYMNTFYYILLHISIRYLGKKLLFFFFCLLKQ